MVATLLLATEDVDLALEGVDEACARALARWERVSVMGAPTAWAYTVALNDARRTARRRSLEDLLLRRPPAQPNVPEAATEIWGLVAGLPSRQREVVVPAQPPIDAPMRAWAHWSDEMHRYLDRQVALGHLSRANPGCAVTSAKVTGTKLKKPVTGIPAGVTIWAISEVGDCRSRAGSGGKDSS